jgi:hypothetical protein
VFCGFRPITSVFICEVCHALFPSDADVRSHLDTAHPAAPAMDDVELCTSDSEPAPRKGEILEAFPALKNEHWEAGKIVVTMIDLSLASREELEKASLKYQSELSNGEKAKPHMASYNTKKELTDVLAKQLFSFACYPSNQMYVDAAVSLVTSFPCLGTFHRTKDHLGIHGWHARLVDKLCEIRRNSKHPEVLANKSKSYI